MSDSAYGATAAAGSLTGAGAGAGAAEAAEAARTAGSVGSVGSVGSAVTSTAAAAPIDAARKKTQLDWPTLLGAAGLAAGVSALVWAYVLQSRWEHSSEELARRHQEAQQVALESRTLAKQAEAVSRDMATKMSLLEARVAESSLQRTQLEELMQSLSRSRDENVLADIESGLRVAQQQAALTGSVEPLATALKQTEERLARVQQARLERVRRAVLQDLDRVRAAGAVDVISLTLKLDEVTRQIDELPLLSPQGRGSTRVLPSATPAVAPAATAGAPAAARHAAGESATDAGSQVTSAASSAWMRNATQMAQHVWSEVRGLVKVTRIDAPEAALLAPEQAVFLRENLRLRLLNARLSLLSRQFDAAQADIRQAQVLIEKYFDKSSRRVGSAVELLKQVAAQSRSVVVPRPDATFTAIAAATAGR